MKMCCRWQWETTFLLHLMNTIIAAHISTAQIPHKGSSTHGCFAPVCNQTITVSETLIHMDNKSAKSIFVNFQKYKFVLFESFVLDSARWFYHKLAAVPDVFQDVCKQSWRVKDFPEIKSNIGYLLYVKFRCVKKRHESRISLCIRIRFWMVSEGRHHSPKLKWKVFRHHSPKSKYFYVDMDEGLSTPSKLPLGWCRKTIQMAVLYITIHFWCINWFGFWLFQDPRSFATNFQLYYLYFSHNFMLLLFGPFL